MPRKQPTRRKGPRDIHFGPKTQDRRQRVRHSGGFTPLEVSGLVAWYDFSDISTLWKDNALTTPVTADADVILGVTDKSGNANHLNVGTNGPAYKTAIINNKSIARFDGTNDRLNRASWTGGSVPQPYTVFLAGKMPGFAEVNSPWTDGGDGITRAHLVMSDASGKWANYSGTAVISSTVSADASSHVFQSQPVDTAGSFRVDGGASVANWSGTSGLQGIDLCSNVAAGGSTFAEVDFAELIIYSGALSLANINLLGTYLATKWGTTWTNVS